MNASQQDANRPLSSRKTSDRSLVLLLAGCLLLTPPLAGIFQLDLRLFGIPFTALYLFAVWGALIVGAARLSQRLQARADLDNEQGNRNGDETG